MTGFGMADGEVSGGQLHFEIRTVNHRHFNVQLKLPSVLAAHEAELRDLLRASIDRGHVLVTARWTEEPPRNATVKVNIDRARNVIGALNDLRTALDLEGEIDLAFVARQPEVLVIAAGDEVSTSWDEIRPVVQGALAMVLDAREREGAVLADEVVGRIDSIGQKLQEVEHRAPQRLGKERDRLTLAVAELLENVKVDEDRLAQEIALLAEKLDVTEETVRLRAHLDAALAAIRRGGPLGKELGFLGQEILREINTIGSKANDASMSHLVVDMKGELEKYREQVENIE